jgi:hypothetical protein
MKGILKFLDTKLPGKANNHKPLTAALLALPGNTQSSLER